MYSRGLQAAHVLYYKEKRREEKKGRNEGRKKERNPIHDLRYKKGRNGKEKVECMYTTTGEARRETKCIENVSR